MLPNGSSIPCADVSIDDVTNSVYVRLLADRELTMIGKYGIMFNLKLANGVMYSSPMVVFAEVSADAEVEYKELNISLGVALTYLPANVAYTGASPKIGPNGTWLVYNDELNAYEDTGEPANYGGLLGEVQSLKDIIETSLTPHFITNAVKVDWETIGKNADGELCYIGAGIGDNEGGIDITILEGYLTDKGYAKHIDIAKEYATKEWVEKKKFITIDSLPQKVSAFANDKGYITLDALAPYAISATTLGGYGITNAYTKTETDSRIYGEVKRLFEDPRFVTAAVNIDGRTIKRDGNGALYVDETALSISGGGGVADSVHWNNVIGKPSWIGSAKPTYKYSEIEERPDLSVYFLASNFTKANIKSTLGISDWALASAKPTYKYSEISNTPDLSVYALNTDLAKKWTQNDAKIANWDSAYSWGNHAAAGYAKASDVTNEFKNYVKLAGDSQSITAQHNFANGLKIGGVALRKVDNYLYLDSSLVLSGGVTMYGDDGTTVKPIWESIPLDSSTLAWLDGKLSVIGGVGGGGISEEFLNVTLQGYQPLLSATNKLPYSLISGTPSIPTKLSQLTDDVVAGNYLSTKGGTVNGNVIINDVLQSKSVQSVRFWDTPDLDDVSNWESGLEVRGVGFGPLNIPNNAHSLGSVFENLNYDSNAGNQVYYSTYTNDVFYRSRFGGSWRDWRRFAFTDDIPTKLSQLTDDVVAGKYLSLTGGTINGSLTLNNPTSHTPFEGAITLDAKSYGSESYSQIRFKNGSDVSTRYGFINLKGSTYGHGSGVEIGRRNDDSIIIWASIDASGITAPSFIGKLTGNADSATNADKLANLGSNKYYHSYSPLTNDDDVAELSIGSYSIGSIRGGANPVPITYSSLSVFGDIYYAAQLCVKNDASSAYLRGITNGTTVEASEWHQIAFTDSNVASATKLQTPRTIWGQSFDGTENVSGSLNGVNAVTSNTTNGYYVGDRTYGLGFTDGGLLLYTYGNTPISLYTSTTERVRIFPNGNVAIGGTTADEKLHVHGTAKFTGDTTFSSKVIVGTIPVYQSADGTLFVDANVVFRGGVAMYGDATTTINEE